MKNWIITTALSWIFKDGFKNLEKQNYVTKALEALYKQKVLKDTWPQFCGGVIGILEDAIDEAKTAKGWTHEISASNIR